MPGFNSVGALLLFWAATAVASPVQTVDQHLPVSTCDPLSKYTTEWFLDNVKSEYEGDFQDTALFYTRRMTRNAIEHAEAHGFVTLWHVWPSWLYREDDVADNPLQCIHRDLILKTNFYENMARAFAIKANGVAAVMHAFEDYDDPPLNGIWGKIELEAVKVGAKVGCLVKMKEDGTDLKVFWEREGQVNGYMRVQERLPYRSRTALGKRDTLAPLLGFLRTIDYEFFDANV